MATPTTQMIVDPKIPIRNRVTLLRTLIQNQQPEAQEVLESILNAAAQTGDNEKLKAMREELEQLIKDLESGPQKIATFIRKMPDSNKVVAKLADGSEAILPCLMDNEVIDSLVPGNELIADIKGSIIISKLDNQSPPIGEEAVFTRRVGPDRIEVSSGNDDKLVLNASKEVIAALDSEDENVRLTPGNRVIINRHQMFALEALPAEDKLGHFQYLCRDEIPNIRAEDIGSPLPFLQETITHLHREMTKPEIGRRYKIRRSLMQMLTGVSGSGKTLHIQAIWREMYQLMAQIIGCPVEKLPFRVLKLRSAQVLSKWLGESDKNIDRYFDELEQLASTTFVWENKEWHLPVLAIMEEADGLSRTRGEDSIHDRIQTTMLQRLDATVSKALSNHLILFFSTSNTPQLIDPAFLRRAGGTITHFGRLNKEAFNSILSKHVKDLPLLNCNNEAEFVETIASLMYPEDDTQMVTLKYQGGGGEVKYRKDFMVGAIIDRAIQKAANDACRAEYQGQAKGITAEEVFNAINSQIVSIVKQLTPGNVINYLDIPEGVKVQDVKKNILD
jgi:SpoVK/Ycf46/Vps4 family AAA+-type ATPase